MEIQSLVPDIFRGFKILCLFLVPKKLRRMNVSKSGRLVLLVTLKPKSSPYVGSSNDKRERSRDTGRCWQCISRSELDFLPYLCIWVRFQYIMIILSAVKRNSHSGLSCSL